MISRILFAFAILLAGCDTHVDPGPPKFTYVPVSISFIKADGTTLSAKQEVTISFSEAQKGIYGIVDGFDTLKTVDSLLVQFNSRYLTVHVDSIGRFDFGFKENLIEGSNSLIFFPYSYKAYISSNRQIYASIYVMM